LKSNEFPAYRRAYGMLGAVEVCGCHICKYLKNYGYLKLIGIAVGDSLIIGGNK
jgi:hypothetical protein